MQFTQYNTLIAVVTGSISEECTLYCNSNIFFSKSTFPGELWSVLTFFQNNVFKPYCNVYMYPKKTCTFIHLHSINNSVSIGSRIGVCTSMELQEKCVYLLLYWCKFVTPFYSSFTGKVLLQKKRTSQERYTKQDYRYRKFL